ncbi:methyltransferase domain-containing protein [Streptomyces sp. ME02-6977A]|uniref:methyltransferase domain-containing protein n=1 Tax=Streptomyces sp. ME02-6977A TaxID=3028671 RepID=UPI0029B6B4B6|nr:methyltransferase domain-containing protein [Streptomyces sp. ME02-6977A]MDX3406095.1 methyltransferase domain-containing protein [Streptomyces sp. ME02-6977A]
MATTDVSTDQQAAEASVAQSVRDYYGKVLASSADLKTTACCTDVAPPPHIAAALAEVHDEVMERFYGCGSPIPPALEGATVLDLGSGSGRDVYVLSQLVGPTGRVIGVDMTEEQLAVARRHQDWHAERFGHANTDFRHGYIEDLAGAGIPDASVDVVVSNCVVNLSPDKPRVLSEIFRVLKPRRRAVLLRHLLRPALARLTARRPGPGRRMPRRRPVHGGLPPCPGTRRLP